MSSASLAFRVLAVALAAGKLAMDANAADVFAFTSSPSSWIGGGQVVNFSEVSARRTYDLGVYTDSVRFSAGGYELIVVGPGLTLPQAGYYPGATRWPFMGAGPGLNLSAPGRGNNRLSGWFHVLQAEYLADGQVAAFAVDFAQYDEENLTKWNRGSIRYRSAVPAPGPAPAIRMDNMRLGKSATQFDVSGPADAACVIQASSDLVNWAPVHTNSISPVGLLAISDTVGVGSSSRFYRAVPASDDGGGVSNNEFVDRVRVPSVGATLRGSNATADREPGEPFHGDGDSGKSVWWTWQAPQTRVVTISTVGSDFDTLMAVYTGDSLTSLRRVASNDDFGLGITSQVSFLAKAGTEYQIAVDGFGGAFGSIVLVLRQ
jgi:hypothetical protein